MAVSDVFVVCIFLVRGCRRIINANTIDLSYQSESSYHIFVDLNIGFVSVVNKM